MIRLFCILALFPLFILGMVLMHTPLRLYDDLLIGSWYADFNWGILISSMVLWFRYRKSITIQKKDYYFVAFLIIFCFLLSFSYILRWDLPIDIPWNDFPRIPVTNWFAKYVIEFFRNLSTIYLIKTYGLVGLACGYSAFVTSHLVSKSPIADEVKNSNEDVKMFLRTMITSVAMLSVIVAVASSIQGEPFQLYFARHICAMGGPLVAVASISAGAYFGAFSYKGMRFIGYLFAFICGSLMGFISYFIISWPFVVTLIYGMPVAIGLFGCGLSLDDEKLRWFIFGIIALVLILLILGMIGKG